MRKFVALVVSLVGVLVFVQALSYSILPLNVAVSAVPMGQKVPMLLLALIPPLLALAIGLGLFFNRKRIAERYTTDGTEALWPSSPDVLRVAIVVLGLGLISNGLPSLARYIVGPFTSWWLSSSVGDGVFMASAISPQQYLIENAPESVAALVSTGLGIWLIWTRGSLVTRFMGDSSTASAAQPVLSECPSCGAAYDPADYEGGVAQPRCGSCKEPLDLSRP